MKTFAMVSVALIALAGCSSPAAAPSPAAPNGQSRSASTTTPTPVPKPLSLVGKWKQMNSKSEDSWQAVTIKKDTIEIQWISDNGDTRSIYWVGSFRAPKTTDDAYAWTSKRDRKKTDSALLASTSKARSSATPTGS